MEEQASTFTSDPPLPSVEDVERRWWPEPRKPSATGLGTCGGALMPFGKHAMRRHSVEPVADAAAATPTASAEEASATALVAPAADSMPVASAGLTEKEAEPPHASAAELAPDTAEPSDEDLATVQWTAAERLQGYHERVVEEAAAARRAAEQVMLAARERPSLAEPAMGATNEGPLGGQRFPARVLCRGSRPAVMTASQASGGGGSSGGGASGGGARPGTARAAAEGPREGDPARPSTARPTASRRGSHCTSGQCASGHGASESVHWQSSQLPIAGQSGRASPIPGQAGRASMRGSSGQTPAGGGGCGMHGGNGMHGGSSSGSGGSGSGSGASGLPAFDAAVTSHHSPPPADAASTADAPAAPSAPAAPAAPAVSAVSIPSGPPVPVYVPLWPTSPTATPRRGPSPRPRPRATEPSRQYGGVAPQISLPYQPPPSDAFDRPERAGERERRAATTLEGADNETRLAHWLHAFAGDEECFASKAVSAAGRWLT